MYNEGLKNKPFKNPQNYFKFVSEKLKQTTDLNNKD